MNSSCRTAQLSTSSNMRRDAPSNLTPGGKKAADQRSTVLGSRIEKKRKTHSNKPTNPSVRATASSELIRVFINNRLGTRTEIPCSPSDTIGALKKVAAAYLGTKPEAMTLKRQSERPLKDFLTLEDYEIHDGSSLDLEVDSGDS